MLHDSVWTPKDYVKLAATLSKTAAKQADHRAYLPQVLNILATAHDAGAFREAASVEAIEKNQDFLVFHEEDGFQEFIKSLKVTNQSDSSSDE